MSVGGCGPAVALTERHAAPGRTHHRSHHHAACCSIGGADPDLVACDQTRIQEFVQSGCGAGSADAVPQVKRTERALACCGIGPTIPDS